MRSLVALRMVIHDRSSTAGALLGVIAIVFLVGQQLSIFFGLLNFMSVLPDHSGVDAWIMSPNLTNADAGGLISGRYIDRVVGLPEVEWAEPLLIGSGLFRKRDGSFEPVRIIGSRRPRLFGGAWEFAQNDERALLDVEAIAIDKIDVSKFGNPQLEEVREIGDFRVRVRAITKGARGFQGTLVFASLDKVREISRTPPGRYSAILVRFKPGTDMPEALERLRALVPQCSVYSSAELARLTRTFYVTNTGIGGSFGFSTTIGIVVGAVIITLTMYTSVLSRYRDFAVMRALGGRRWDITVIVISQVLIITSIGLFLGFLLLATLLNATVGSAIPSYFPAYVPPYLAGATLVVSLFGSLIALRVALKADPADVFH
jgi:putative ABC transport system permease protein